MAGSNDAQYMNLNFSVPLGSFLSQVPFLLESRQPGELLLAGRHELRGWTRSAGRTS